ncbi:hypothetical protein ACLQ2P_23305 [Actinomadura citrea]|uniref:hypothetical protein n=1 Tax=Actinomadura citrea TaxID=46158 RepID=UPI003CE4F094
MSNVRDLMAATADDIVLQLAEMSKEFPNWTIKLVDSFAPYQAVRDDTEPMMLGARSCAGLRALLEKTDVAGLAALREHMTVRGFEVEFDGSSLTVKAALDGAGVPRAVKITCKARGSDGGRLWFWTHWGEPLAEAGDITGAEVALVGLLAARP